MKTLKMKGSDYILNCTTHNDSINPNYADAYNGKGAALKMLQKYEEAIS